jgi:hypothetical protein
MVIVKTDRNIIQDNNYSNCCGYSGIDGDYSNLDANSPKNEIQRFQAWMNAEKGMPLSGGNWDADTSALYRIYGRDYESTYNKDFDKKNAEADTNIPTYSQGGKYGGSILKEYVVPTTKVNKDKTKTDNTSNSKKMSDTTKILIGLGIFLVLGTSIYFITKKK